MSSIQPDIRLFVYIGGILSKDPIIEQALFKYYTERKNFLRDNGNFTELHNLSEALMFSNGPNAFKISKE